VLKLTEVENRVLSQLKLYALFMIMATSCEICFFDELYGCAKKKEKLQNGHEVRIKTIIIVIWLLFLVPIWNFDGDRVAKSHR